MSLLTTSSYQPLSNDDIRVARMPQHDFAAANFHGFSGLPEQIQPRNKCVAGCPLGEAIRHIEVVIQHSPKKWLAPCAWGSRSPITPLPLCHPKKSFGCEESCWFPQLSIITGGRKSASLWIWDGRLSIWYGLGATSKIKISTTVW